MPSKRSWANAASFCGAAAPRAAALIDAGHGVLDTVLRAGYELDARLRPLRKRLRARLAVRRRRLLAALAIAGAVHAALIGLVHFHTPRPRAAPMIAVTRLVQPSPEAPEHAAHVAAADQRDGRGTAQRTRTAGRQAPPRSATPAPPLPPAPPVPAIGVTAAPAVTAGAGATGESADRTAVSGRRAPTPDAGIAARKAARAAYLATWRGAIEREGTQHYPQSAAGAAARSLVLEVTLRADGSIVAARVARSSGSKRLDRAALDILHRAAPFPAFPDALRARGRTLTFAYRWHFLPPSDTASSP